VTIPQELRERFGLLPNTEVEFVATPDGRELRLLKSSKPSGRGSAHRAHAWTGYRQTFHRRTAEINEKRRLVDEDFSRQHAATE
jgi:bifunctional DNA-binding transcriptional regulator/antitoxin component of YhaV-PrlF toxin-antitoxin module